MANGCCKLVGNFNVNLDGCIISVSNSSKIEIIKECGGELLVGPTIGNLTMTAYAVDLTQGNPIHVGCPGRAGLSVNWVRRYDCDTNTVYFISAGQGSSYKAGEETDLAKFGIELGIGTGRTYSAISANSSSGPATIYMDTPQEDGYGLVYTGEPLPFDTDDTLIFQNFLETGGPALYLQNFSIELSPGEIPVANYSFVFWVDD